MGVMARPRIHDEAVRSRLLECASEAIAARGEEGLSLRSVAADAGTTTAAVYTLFGSRGALIRALVEEGFRRFADRLDQVGQTEDPAADLLALGAAYRHNALENPHFYQVMFTSARHDHENSTFQTLVHAVARVCGLENSQARVHAERLWAYVHGLVSLELAGLRPGPEGQRERDYLQSLQAGAALLPPAGAEHRL